MRIFQSSLPRFYTGFIFPPHGVCRLAVGLLSLSPAFSFVSPLLLSLTVPGSMQQSFFREQRSVLLFGLLPPLSFWGFFAFFVSGAWCFVLFFFLLIAVGIA